MSDFVCQLRACNDFVPIGLLRWPRYEHCKTLLGYDLIINFRGVKPQPPFLDKTECDRIVGIVLRISLFISQLCSMRWKTWISPNHCITVSFLRTVSLYLFLINVIWQLDPGGVTCEVKPECLIQRRVFRFTYKQSESLKKPNDLHWVEIEMFANSLKRTNFNYYLYRHQRAYHRRSKLSIIPTEI